MIEITVSHGGLELDVVAEELQGPLRQKLVERLADVVWASAFWNAPRRTGHLAESIVKDIGVGEASVQVLAPYAEFVVKGTAPHEIRPVNASVLRFEASDGGLVFTPIVHHPGTKPNRWLEEAAEEGASKAEEVFTGLLEELS